MELASYNGDASVGILAANELWLCMNVQCATNSYDHGWCGCCNNHISSKNSARFYYEPCWSNDWYSPLAVVCSSFLHLVNTSLGGLRVWFFLGLPTKHFGWAGWHGKSIGWYHLRIRELLCICIWQHLWKSVSFHHLRLSMALTSPIFLLTGLYKLSLYFSKGNMPKMYQN